MDVTKDASIAHFETAVLVSHFICFTLGLIINLLVLVSIVTSPEMQFHLRNKLIINLCACHLTETVFRFPVALYLKFKNPDIIQYCSTWSAIVNLEQIQLFIVNWNLVLLISVLIAEIRNVNLAVTWSKIHRTIACSLLLALPWGTAMIIVPLLMNAYSKREYSASNLPNGCILPTFRFLVLVTALDSILPHLTTVVLITAAIIMRCRSWKERIPLDEEGTRRNEPHSRVVPLPNYITATTFTILCDVPIILSFYQMYGSDENFRIKAVRVSEIIADVSIIINALPWLLLPDVRHRIKTVMHYSRRGSNVGNTIAVTSDQVL